MSRLFHKLADVLVDHRWSVVLLMVLISASAIVGYVDPSIVRVWFQSTVKDPDASAPQTTAATSERKVPPPNVEPFSLTGYDAILVVDCDTIFTPRGADAVRRVIERLENQDYIDRVMWLDTVPPLNIFGLRESALPRSTAPAGVFEAARKRALANPLIGGQLLARDGRTMLLLLSFDWLFVTSDEDCTTRLKDIAGEALADFPDVPMNFMVTGRVPTHLAALQTHEDNQVKFQVIGYGMIGLMTVILFRGIRAVLIVALAPAVGVFWTLGLLRFLELEHNPFNDVVLPILLSLVGLTDGVHLMVQIRKLRAQGLSEREAARNGVKMVGLACALTSLTTAIGFASLSFAHHRLVREFGLCCVGGVMLTFVAVITVIPLACSTRLGRNLHIGLEKGLVDRHLSRIVVIINAVLKRPKLLSIVALLSTLVLTGVSLSLRPDERNTNALPGESEAARALRYMDERFGGLEVATIEISWPNDRRDDDPELLSVIAEVHEVLQAEPLIGRPLSLHSFVEALPGDGPVAERITMLELLPPPLKRAFYTPEYHLASVSFRVQDLGIAAYSPVFERVEAGLLRLMQAHPGFHLELSGRAAWRWRNLYQIVIDLAASLGSAMVVIFVVLALVYRSVRIGLISVVPNVFPLAVTGSFLVLTGQNLEIVTVCAFTVCLGIAVDDTIHFLTRLQEERLTTPDLDEAIRKAFTGVGTALIMTTIVLVVGFSSVLFSDSRDHYIFASMSGLTIATALFADLVFLPALLSWLRDPDPA